MDFLVMIGKAFLVIVAVLGVITPLILERNYIFIWQIWRRFNIKMLLETLGVLLLTIVIGITLMWAVPFLKYGLLSIFYEKAGNVMLVPVLEGSESESIFVRMLPPLFFLTLLVALPYLARIEEKIFRGGYEDWPSIFRQSVKFGLLHLVAGVPVAMGIALIIPGLFYGYKYKKAFERNIIQNMNYFEARDEAVLVSTTYHTMYNSILTLLMILGTALMI